MISKIVSRGLLTRECKLTSVIHQRFASDFKSADADKKTHSDNFTVINGKEYPKDEFTNITPRVISALNRKLYQQTNHPLCIIKRAIIDHFYSSYKVGRGPIFTVVEDLDPVVTTNQCFDSLLTPKTHASRRKHDNFYVNERTLMRPHTTAHDSELIRAGLNAFLNVGDVYRRDTIDRTHYPVFHQCEGVRLFSPHELTTAEDSEEIFLFEAGRASPLKQACHTLEASKLTEYDLKQTLEDLVVHLFGKNIQYRWVDASFPFTHPSFEMDIKIGDEWIEMLGCGVLRQEILDRSGADQKVGWAFGLGLERLAMKLFQIPDIRLFWSEDRSFLSQFQNFDEKNFRTFRFTDVLSKQPPTIRDIAFFLNDEDNFNSNDFYDLVRTLGGDLIENVHLKDDFKNPLTKKRSHCYQISYRHMIRPLNGKEINDLDESIKKEVLKLFDVTPRWK